VFRAAGLDFANFTETTPQELPVAPADQVRAWKGPHPKVPNTELTVEIASWHGRITRTRVAPPWAKPNPRPKTGSSTELSELYAIAITVIVLLSALVFARRNWKLGRIDRKGALRVAAARFSLAMVAWVGSVHAVPSTDMVGLISRAAADWLFSAAMLWLVYLALEPAVRARWPHSLVTWNRALAGRWLDPQVASHVLIGAAVGCLIWQTFTLSDVWLGPKNILNSYGGLFYAEGARHWIGGTAGCLGGALRIGLTFFFALFILRMLLRRDWLAAAVATVFGIFMEGGVINSHNWQLRAVVYALVYFTIFIVLMRFGLIATISAVFFINSFNALTVGLDWKAWYVPYGLATMMLLVAITGIAFWRSLGSRGLLGDAGEAG
jgi:serine/threonine-protein kinase